MSPVQRKHQVHPIAQLQARAHIVKHSTLPQQQREAILHKIDEQQRQVRLVLVKARIQRERHRNRIARWVIQQQLHREMDPPQRQPILPEDVNMTDAPLPYEAAMPASATAAVAAPPAKASSSSEASSASTSPLPTTTPELYKYIENKMKRQFGRFIYRCALGPSGGFIPGRLPLTPGETQYVVDHCEGLITAPLLLANQLKDLNLKATLLAITGRSETPRARFPVVAQQAASKAYAHFESENWGSDAARRSASPSASPKTPTRARRDSRIGAVAGPSHRRRSSAPINQQSVNQNYLPPPHHAIYGTNGIMHDIQQIQGPARKSYKIVEGRGSDHHAFGHNNIAVGQWWPLQVCALRDGAHGSIGGGMSHRKDEGVRSIVINSAYEDTDRDMGEVIWYSMPGSTENRDPHEPKPSAATEAMRYSWARNKDIRVIRGSGAGWSGRPTVGLRYDGLYRVTAEEMPTNSLGGKYVRFKLVRNDQGQPELASVISRPTPLEINQEKFVKDGYH